MSLSKFISQTLIKTIKTQVRNEIVIDGYISQFSTSCPNKDALLNILNVRNNLVNGLNPMLSYLDSINSVILSTENTLTIFKTLFDLVKLTPAPAATVVAFSNPLSAILIDTDKKIDQTSSILDGANKAIEKIKESIQIIVNKLQLLDSLMEKCFIEKNIPENEINKVLFSFNSESIDNNINPISDNYKGFILEVETEPSNLSYKRRIGVAKTQQGIILLKTTPSFTSNNKTLLDELKLVIDRDNLKAN